MATKKPRMMITLEESTNDAIHRLAAIQGRPPASVVREFVEQCAPLFKQISDALEQAMSLEKEGPINALNQLGAFLQTTLKSGAATENEIKELQADMRQRKLSL